MDLPEVFWMRLFANETCLWFRMCGLYTYELNLFLKVDLVFGTFAVIYVSLRWPNEFSNIFENGLSVQFGET